MDLPASAILEPLRFLGLLLPEQLAETERLVRELSAAKAVTDELVKRGWLTVYQGDELSGGHGYALLVGQHVLFERLGAGGMGEVFRARHKLIYREDALKRILPGRLDHPVYVERFLREARALASLSPHRNLVQFYDVNQTGGSYYMTMELVRGVNLEQYLRERGSLPVAESIEYVRQACVGMQIVHEKGIVHRDLKPENLMRTEQKQIKILDMGLAHVKEASRLTHSSASFGTPDYMAPEQMVDGHVDIRADVYSLGCTLYFLLTRRVPYHEVPFVQRAIAEPAPVESFCDDLPRPVAECMRKMMAKKREARYQTPGEAATALGSFLRRRGTGEQRRSPPSPRPPEPSPPTDALVAGQIEVVQRRIEPVTGGGLLPAFANSIGMQFALIPAGTFLMGSPTSEKNQSNDEKQHRVTLTKPIYMGVHQVTQAQWIEVMGSNPSYFSATGGGKAKVKGLDTSDFPVEDVSWEDAKAFLDKLSARAAEKEKGRVYRLPTEAEWEYACRGGVSSSTPYHFGDTISAELANYEDNLGRTSKVGSYPANAWGLHDMHGNVWEWCQDWYGDYPDGEATDPSGPPEGFRRVYRGGGWGDSARSCRSAYRCRDFPGLRNDYLGFRLALVPAS